MADLLIKPLTGAGNTVTIQDQAGGAILTSGNSGATIGGGVTIPAAGITGVLPVGVTGGSGLNAVSTSAGSMINHYSTSFNGGANSYGGQNTSPAEISTNFRFSYTPIAVGSKLLVWYQSTKSHNNTSTAYYAIGYEVTASSGTATASTLVSQVITVGGDSGTSHKNAYFHHGYGPTTTYGYDAFSMLIDHSPSYTLGEKIWYTWIGFSNGAWFYVTNDGDVLFKVTEIKG
jgi:hypothetical protein